MAVLITQPAQVLNAFDPGGTYSVIDNSAAPAFPTLNAATGQGYDTTFPGANDQGANKFSNGNIPDYLSAGKTMTCTASFTPMIISYKLPS